MKRLTDKMGVDLDKEDKKITLAITSEQEQIKALDEKIKKATIRLNKLNQEIKELRGKKEELR